MPGGSPAAALNIPGSPRTQAEREAQWAPYVQRMQQRSGECDVVVVGGGWGPGCERRHCDVCAGGATEGANARPARSRFLSTPPSPHPSHPSSTLDMLGEADKLPPWMQAGGPPRQENAFRRGVWGGGESKREDAPRRSEPRCWRASRDHFFFFHCPPSLLPTPELKQAKAHERAPAAARLARFLPRKQRDKLAQGGGGGEVAAEGGAAPAPGGGRYARAPAGPTSDPDKRE